MTTLEEAQDLIELCAEIQKHFRRRLHALETALTELNGGKPVTVSCLVNLEGASIDELIKLGSKEEE